VGKDGSPDLDGPLEPHRHLALQVFTVLGKNPKRDHASVVGLAIIVPVLGHATWHLYRCVVERDSSSVLAVGKAGSDDVMTNATPPRREQGGNPGQIDPDLAAEDAPGDRVPGEDLTQRQEKLIDEAVEETYPASDPIAPKRITK
jgi:hypothetical protein